MSYTVNPTNKEERLLDRLYREIFSGFYPKLINDYGLPISKNVFSMIEKNIGDEVSSMDFLKVVQQSAILSLISIVDRIEIREGVQDQLFAYFIEEVNFLSRITSDICADTLREYFQFLLAAYNAYLRLEVRDLECSMFDLAYLGRCLFKLLDSISELGILPNQDDISLPKTNLNSHEIFIIHDVIKYLSSLQISFSTLKRKFESLDLETWQNGDFYLWFRDKYQSICTTIELCLIDTQNFQCHLDQQGFSKKFLPTSKQ